MNRLARISTQDVLGTPGQHGTTMFSRPQAVAQLTAWAGLAGTGFFLIDSTDMPPEGSVFSRVLGPVQREDDVRGQAPRTPTVSGTA